MVFTNHAMDYDTLLLDDALWDSLDVRRPFETESPAIRRIFDEKQRLYSTDKATLRTIARTYYDERNEKMWRRIANIIEDLERIEGIEERRMEGYRG